MDVKIDGKQFVFRDSLNFQAQLELNDLYEEQTKGEIKQSVFLLWLIGIFVKSIDGSEDNSKNIEIIKNLESMEDIQILTDQIEKISTQFTKDTKKKGKK